MCIHASCCVVAAGASCIGAFAAYATQDQVAGTAAALCASMRPPALRLLVQVAEVHLLLAPLKSR